MGAKQNSVNVIIILFLVGVACWGFALFSGGDTSNNSGTDSTMGTTQKQQQEVIFDFGDIGYKIEITGQSIQGADQAVTHGKKQVDGIANTITECQKLVGECRTLTAENQRIFKSIGSGAETGAKTE